MKKTIVVEILLLFTCVVLIACAIRFFVYANDMATRAYGAQYVAPEIKDQMVAFFSHDRDEMRTRGIFFVIAAVANLAAMVLIALRDIPALRDKLAAHRAQRAEQKAEKAVADKQARIEKLQAELDELKKDE